ncbi:hypothetical protein ACAW74_10315 [Fibrella sp. WM1]|uniref:hypothetical protein n=1 Tax=Fibrella musci TaxID=3242485 RepID=UPI0035215AFD
MTRWIFVFLLTSLLSCTNKTTLNPEGGDVLESSATLRGDNLPVDGCNAHLWLMTDGTSSDSRTYIRLPTPATRPLMDRLIQAEVAASGNGYWMGSKDVTIRYRETGQTTTLQCGWGATQQVKTIELLDIR